MDAIWWLQGYTVPTTPSICGKLHAVRVYSDYLRQCAIANRSQAGLRILDDPHEVMKIAGRLPSWMTSRRDRKAAEESWEADYPDFDKLVKFVESEARIMNSPFTRQATMEKTLTETRKATTRAVGSQQEEEGACKFCSRKNHSTTECSQLQEASQEEKEGFVIKNKLCWKCLCKGHISKS